MELIPVQSSNVAAVGHDGSKQILFIQFKGNAKVYEHHGVSADVFKQLQTAESVGSFYARNIKGKYPNQPPQEA
ncbi:KTSC domain-containing protein [Paenibacillus macerans]|uniref:KTSC domain-containing protein n=1 Tax=Paenibacillus macerans TaxID=44252 RepID=UPI003D321EAF